MFKYWEDAAEQVVREIYEINCGPAPHMDVSKRLAEVRSLLEQHIDAHWIAGDGDAEDVANSWKNFGASARALGLQMGFIEKFGLDYDEVHAVVCRKQRDYGHKNISRFGRQGLMVRLHDKVARLENLLSSSRTPNNESIEDNVLDLVGYACIGMMWERKTFLLACYDPTVAERVTLAPDGQGMTDMFAKLGMAISS